MYRKIRTIKSSTFLYYIAIMIVYSVNPINGQCPWQKEVPDLQNSCLCAYNLAQELSVQCDQVSK